MKFRLASVQTYLKLIYKELIQYANQTQPIVPALLCTMGVNVLSLKSIAYKLQKALTFKGRYITINQNQFYSEALEKMSTKYILKEKVEEKGKTKYKTLLETFRLIDVVNYLADILKEGE